MYFTVKTGAKVPANVYTFRMLEVACQAFTELKGADFVVVVTSGNDSLHMATSRHYQDEGLDFRTGHGWKPQLMTESEAGAVKDRMKQLLGRDYDVVLEKDHIHVEHDPKPVPAPAESRAA